MLGIEELLDLEESLQEELKVNLTTILTRLNVTGQLEEFLNLLDLGYLLGADSRYQTYKTGKIIVIGYSDVKKKDLEGVGKSLGIERERFDFYLDYKAAVKFDFRKTQWEPSYSLIMVGPMPHSGEAKGDYASIISALEAEDGYPPVIRLGSNGLKITKSDFRKCLEAAISDQTIAL